MIYQILLILCLCECYSKSDIISIPKSIILFQIKISSILHNFYFITISLKITQKLYGAQKTSLRISGYNEKDNKGKRIAETLEKELKGLTGLVKVVYRSYGNNYIEAHFVNLDGFKRGQQKVDEVSKKFQEKLHTEIVRDQNQDQIQKQQEELEKKKELINDFKQLAINNPQDFINILKSYPMMNFAIEELIDQYVLQSGY